MGNIHHKFRIIILSTSSLLILSGCFPISMGISSGRIKFDALQYPASMSSSLYGPHEEVLTVGKELVVIKKLHFEKNSWSLIYSLVSLSSNNDIVKKINHEISQSGGDGILNVEITSENGTMNKIYILNLLPIWPTYSKLTIEGDIVKYASVSMTQ